MLNTITPEKAGISSRHVKKFIETLNRRGLPMHSVLLMKGNDIFAEYYWKPFDKDFCHRMYSQTKSYVAIAIGLLVEDGKLDINTKIADIFPEKIDCELQGYMSELTVEHLLKMETCGVDGIPFWITDTDPDRTHMYFAKNKGTVPPDMRWYYDSCGSQVLCTIVEKLSGKSLFDFMNERIFKHLDAFHTATVLKTQNDDSWGDSALICTPRDMVAFARFVMNWGEWNGKRLMNSEYLKKATSRIVDNNMSGFDEVYTQGYGYQIWRAPENGFSFNGMGSELTLCLPDKDLIFVCTADTQGYGAAKSLIFTALYEIISDNLGDEELPEDPEAYNEALKLGEELDLYYITGPTESPYSKELDGKVWKCDENPMGIKEFSFKFNSDNTAELHYTNAQGKKVLPFGLGKNVFAKFPHLGYMNEHGGVVTTDGFMYDGAFSGSWREEKKLLIKVQIIDRYFGTLIAMFSFKDDRAYVIMNKVCEGFMDEYEGHAVAHLQK